MQPEACREGKRKAPLEAGGRRGEEERRALRSAGPQGGASEHRAELAIGGTSSSVSPSSGAGPSSGSRSSSLGPRGLPRRPAAVAASRHTTAADVAAARARSPGEPRIGPPRRSVGGSRAGPPGGPRSSRAAAATSAEAGSSCRRGNSGSAGRSRCRSRAARSTTSRLPTDQPMRQSSSPTSQSKEPGSGVGASGASGLVTIWHPLSS
ncbi:unnamed protein product, partial [Prorocentrum cordatum]